MAANPSTRTLVGVVALVVCGAVLAWRAPTAVQVLEERREADRAEAKRAKPTPPAPPAENALRVLFVGNSYTYVNDLPGTIRRLAEAAKVERPFYAQSETPGGCTLERHVKGGRATRKIAQGKWDVVVLQDQSQRPSFADWQVKREVYPFARELHEAATAAGAETVFFLTWGRKQGDQANKPNDTFAGMQSRLDRGYGRIAAELKATVAPVGRAWQLAIEARPTLALWSSDGSHPSQAGTYLAACVFFETLYRKSVLLNPYRPASLGADGTFLQEMAHRALLDWKAKGWAPEGTKRR